MVKGSCSLDWEMSAGEALWPSLAAWLSTSIRLTEAVVHHLWT